MIGDMMLIESLTLITTHSFYFFVHSFFSLSPQKQDVQHQYGNAGGKCSRGK